MKDDIPKIVYTVKEMLESMNERMEEANKANRAKQSELIVLQRKTHEQALKTNGRLLVLEGNSIGFWISKNKGKAATLIISLLLSLSTLLFSDIPTPLIEAIKAWGGL